MYRKNINFFFLILSGIIFLTFPYQLEVDVSIVDGIPSSPTSGTASSSYPTAFISNSGKVHLFFLHAGGYQDVSVNTYYHTYELDESWSVPCKVFHNYYTDPTIFEIIPSEHGFTLYFQNHEKSGNGLRKGEFYEQTNEWSEHTDILTSSIVAEYFQLSENNIRSLNIQSFHLLENGACFLFWSFEFTFDSDETHPFEGLPLFSKHDKDGNLQSVEESDNGDTIVKFQNDSYYLYNSNFDHRIIFFSNGTQLGALPQSTGFSNISDRYWEDCHVQLIEKRFLLFYLPARDWNLPGEWGMLDLAAENLSLKVLDPPKKPSNPANLDLYGLNFLLHSMSSDEIIFDAAIRTNTSIEIWKFNFFNGSWRQVDTLEYHNSGSWELDPFTIDFLQREKTFQIFWDQEVIHLLHEIFTVQYDPESEDWGSIIQVTDTNTISDDFEGGVPGLTLVTVVITLLAAIFFRKTALFITRF